MRRSRRTRPERKQRIGEVEEEAGPEAEAEEVSGVGEEEVDAVSRGYISGNPSKLLWPNGQDGVTPMKPVDSF